MFPSYSIQSLEFWFNHFYNHEGKRLCAREDQILHIVQHRSKLWDIFVSWWSLSLFCSLLL